MSRKPKKLEIPTDPMDPDAKLWKLVRSFAAAEDAIHGLCGGNDDDAMDRLIDESARWEDAIVNTPARTPAGIMVKLTIVCDCLTDGSRPEKKMLGQGSSRGKLGGIGIETASAVSLWRDMVSMFGAPPVIYAGWRPKTKKRKARVSSAIRIGDRAPTARMGGAGANRVA